MSEAMLALLLIAALGADSPRYTTRQCSRGEGGRSSRGIPCGAEEPTYLTFADPSGAGLPVISHHNTALCDALAAEVPSWSALTGGGVGWPVWDPGTLYSGANTVVSHAGGTWHCPAGNCFPGVEPGVSAAWVDAAGTWKSSNFPTSATVYYLDKTWICSGASCSFSEVPGTAADWTQLGGNWCLGGDGLAVTGSEATFATFGSPSVIETPVCPSGLDCLAATGQPIQALQLDGTAKGTRSGLISSPPGSFSVCAWQHGAGVAGTVVARDGAARVFALDNYSDGARFLVFKTGGANTTVASSGTSQDSMSLLCGVYKYVADGSSELTAFFNGAPGTKSTTGVGPPAPAASQRVTVGYGEVFADYRARNVFGAFYVDQELSPTQIAAIARRVLADKPKAVIRGGQSYVDMTYSRTGSRLCSRADNTGSIIPANRPCIARNGILSEGAATNKLVRSQEINDASWTKAASGGASTPAVTPNAGLGPDSTLTAERVQFSACSSNPSSSEISQSVSAGTHVVSVYLRGYNGASGSVSLCGYNGGDCVQCAFTGAATTRCEKSIGAATTFVMGCLNNTAVYPASLNTGAADVLVWGAQIENGPVATSYIPATSAAATRGASLSYFVDPSLTINPARFSASLTANIISAPGLYASFLRLAGTSYQTDVAGRGVWLYSNNTSGTTFRAYSANNANTAVAVTSVIAPPASPFNVVAHNDGSTLNFSMGSTTSTPGASAPGAFENIKFIDIGNQQGAPTFDALGGFISKVCLDPRPTRCR